MPTVLRRGRWTVSIFTRDHPPPHVHVRGSSGDVKVALSPVRVQGIRGLADREAQEAVRLVVDHREHLLACWRRIHG